MNIKLYRTDFFYRNINLEILRFKTIYIIYDL